MIAKPLRSTDRLFQIIQILRRSSRPITAQALAGELEVSTRTIYRDIAHLMGQRVPVSGEAGVGYVLGSGYDMPPLALTPVEIEAIVLGAQWWQPMAMKCLHVRHWTFLLRLRQLCPSACSHLSLRRALRRSCLLMRPRIRWTRRTFDLQYVKK